MHASLGQADAVNTRETAARTQNTDEVCDALWFHRLRRLNRSVAKWRDQDCHDNHAQVLQLDRRLCDLLHQTPIDTLALRKLLYDAVGALSSPRARSQSCLKNIDG